MSKLVRKTKKGIISNKTKHNAEFSLEPRQILLVRMQQFFLSREPLLQDSNSLTHQRSRFFPLFSKALALVVGKVGDAAQALDGLQVEIRGYCAQQARVRRLRHFQSHLRFLERDLNL